MRLNRICAIVTGLLVSITCTTLAFASEETEQSLLTPYYRETKEFEIPLEDFYSFECYSSPYMDIGYAYSGSVENGKVRYISQIKQSKYFNSKYWGRWDGSTSITCGNGSVYGGPVQECFTCCISMSLSYIGVNKTPENILDFGQGLTIVNSSWGGATYKSSSFSAAFDNFANGNGKYSPPIIHLNNYSYAGHYVIVIGRTADNVYQVLDPALDKIWDITINGSSASYTLPNGKTKSDTVSSAHQYYMESASLVKPFHCCIDTKTDSVCYTGDVTINGWAIYGKGINKVKGTINGKNVEFTQQARADVAKVYTGYPTGKEGFKGTIPATYLKNGNNKLELTAYSDSEAFSIGTLNIEFLNSLGPVVSDVDVTGDTEGYTISCKITDDLGIDRVQLPTWTELNGQDDIDKNWSASEFSKGKQEGEYWTYRVNRKDHNNEAGTYHTHIYAYDISGNVTTYGIKYFFDEPDEELTPAESIAPAASATPAESIAPVASATPSDVEGDVDGDGSVTAADALLVLKYAANTVSFDDEITQRSADVNGNGCIDASDALCILKIVAKTA